MAINTYDIAGIDVSAIASGASATLCWAQKIGRVESFPCIGSLSKFSAHLLDVNKVEAVADCLDTVLLFIPCHYHPSAVAMLPFVWEV